MNKLFKFLVLILVIEICLGYIIYLKNSTVLSGHYVSSTLRAINKIINVFEIKKIEKQKNYNLNIGLHIQDPDFRNISDNCKIHINKNQHIKISGIESLRRKVDLQSDLEFLNYYDEKEHYLIVIIGNSEALGSHQNFDERLHILLQKKLRNKIKTKKLFVVNASYHGGMISDHLRDLLLFSLIYKPDLAIFYSGGNELIMADKYEKILNKEVINKSLNTTIDFYENDLISPNKIRHCLDKSKYLTKENFYREHSILNLEQYITFHFKKIKKTLKQKSIEFIFYIQPLEPTPPSLDDPKYDNYNKIINLNIDDDKYMNLNLQNFRKTIDFTDLFHTNNAEQISQFFFEKIILDYEKEILKKINNEIN